MPKGKEMASPLIIAALTAGLSGMAFEPPQATRYVVQAGGNCQAAASQVVSETGGQLLSAQASGNSCVVTVLVQRDGERPKKVTKKVPM
jgi:hypothetical protein